MQHIKMLHFPQTAGMAAAAATLAAIHLNMALSAT